MCLGFTRPRFSHWSLLLTRRNNRGQIIWPLSLLIKLKLISVFADYWNEDNNLQMETMWTQCHMYICYCSCFGILLVSARRAIDERTGDIFEAIKNMSGKEAAGTLRWPEGGNFRSCYLKERKAYQRRRKGSSAEIPPENSGIAEVLGNLWIPRLTDTWSTRSCLTIG